ncbi:MAG: AAA family ATPase [Pseudomonadota bacterium]
MTKATDQVQPPLKVMGLGEFRAQSFPRKIEILSPWMTSKSLSMIYAQRGVGKTHLIISACLTVAGGGDLLGWHTERPRRVLHVDSEMPGVDLQNRYEAALRFPGVKRPSSHRLRILSADAQTDAMRDLNTEEGQQDIYDSLGDAEVIVLDNKSSLCRSGRENDAEAWTLMQEFLLRLRREGRSVVLVHHAGKNGSQRGTSRHEDVLDTVINLRRPADYSPGDGARFEVHFEKTRGFMGEEAEPFEARLTERGWVRGAINNPVAEQILELNKQGLSQRDIGLRVGVSAATVNRILRASKSS